MLRYWFLSLCALFFSLNSIGAQTVEYNWANPPWLREGSPCAGQCDDGVNLCNGQTVIQRNQNGREYFKENGLQVTYAYQHYKSFCWGGYCPTCEVTPNGVTNGYWSTHTLMHHKIERDPCSPLSGRPLSLISIDYRTPKYDSDPPSLPPNVQIEIQGELVNGNDIKSVILTLPRTLSWDTYRLTSKEQALVSNMKYVTIVGSGQGIDYDNISFSSCPSSSCSFCSCCKCYRKKCCWKKLRIRGSCSKSGCSSRVLRRCANCNCGYAREQGACCYNIGGDNWSCKVCPRSSCGSSSPPFPQFHPGKKCHEINCPPAAN